MTVLTTAVIVIWWIFCS